jgi:putative hydrolase of the HAD superfamily
VAGCRAVLFDFGGTLDADGVAWKDRVTSLFRDEGVIVAPEQFDRVFYAADDALVGTVGATFPFRETVSRLVQGVTRGLGLDDPMLADRVTMRFLAQAHETLQRNVPLLLALRQRYRLGIVSNFYGNLATVCDDSGIREFFDVITDSAQVGARKPDPRIFSTTLERLCVSPADAVFVGDSPSRDMAGARTVGMPHVRLAAKTAHVVEPCCPGDPVIHTLNDLEALLL